MQGILLLAPECHESVRANVDRAMKVPLTERAKAFELRTSAAPLELQVSGDRAVIGVKGMLVGSPAWWLEWLEIEHTVYSDVFKQFDMAQGNPSVKGVDLKVASPGGELSGLFELLDRIELFDKPITVHATRAQSAAYGIAAVAGDEIVAAAEHAVFGSVGIRATYRLNDTVVDISNTDSPNKSPDLSHESGKQIIRAELDEVFELFAERIARGRGVSVAQVKGNFGKGGSMLAASALRAGLIDRLEKPKAKTASSGAVAMATPEKTLDQAKAEGQAEERARCLSHIELAAKSGQVQLAVDAIKSGRSASDPVLIYEHLNAEKNAKDATARATETTAAVVPTPAPSAADPNEDAFSKAFASAGGEVLA